MALTVETVSEVQQRSCADCGRPFSSVHGFVYKDGNAYAVYHALLQTEHPTRVADLALSFGSWDEGATGVDRARVGVRIWLDDDQLTMHIADRDESAWGDSETFGKMARRDDVLGTAREQEALRTAELVVDGDARVRDHLA